MESLALYVYHKLSKLAVWLYKSCFLGLCYENQATYLGILFWIAAYSSKSQVLKITVVSNPKYILVQKAY